MSEGIVTKVNHGEWITPVSPVIKSVNSVEICDYFKVTLNLVIVVDHSPLPRIEKKNLIHKSQIMTLNIKKINKS